MIKIYFSYVCRLYPLFLDHKLQNTWNFLSDESNENIFCHNIWFLFSAPETPSRPIKVKWCLIIHDKPLSTTTGFMLMR